MKKKLLSLVMVLAMALTLLPTAAFAEDTNHTAEVTVTENATVEKTSASTDTIKVSWTAPTVGTPNPELPEGATPALTDADGIASVSVALAGTGLTAKDNGLTKAPTGTNTYVEFVRDKDFTVADNATTPISLTATVTFTIGAQKELTVTTGSAPDTTTSKATVTFSFKGNKSTSTGTLSYTPSAAQDPDQLTEAVSNVAYNTSTKKLSWDYVPATVPTNTNTAPADFTVSLAEKGTSSNTPVTDSAPTATNISGTWDGTAKRWSLTADYDMSTLLTANPTKTYVITVMKGQKSATAEVGGSSSGGDNKTEIMNCWPVPTSKPPFTVGSTISFSIKATVASTAVGEGASVRASTGTESAEAAAALELTDVTWTLKGGAEDASGTLTRAPSTPGTYDLEFDFALTTEGAKTFKLAQGLTCTLGDVEVVAAPPTPTTPTDTIPDAGNVTNSAAAESAIKNIQNSDADKIAEDVGKELTDTSSSASTETIDKLEALDQAVQDKAGITVAVSPDSKAPDALNTKKVSIVGAALNAEKTSNTKIELQISSPKTERTLGRTYDNDVAVQFSMTLTNVVSTKKLAVPVIISLPLPSGISSSRAVVLHYAGTDSASQVLPSKVSGGYISFVVTGFSDFIITQRAEKKTSSGGGGGGYSKVTNIPVTVTPNTPSTPAGIFTDVPANHSFASQITWARDNGVMGGYSDGSFRPTNPTNRQQLWMVLARLSGASPADMAAAREWAVNAGISDGTNGEGTLSRQQLVTMLYRYAQSQEMNLEGAADLSTYPDNGAVASYAGEALAWAVGKGIVTGTSDGRLNPEGTATRGQFAVMMYRFSHQG